MDEKSARLQLASSVEALFGALRERRPVDECVALLDRVVDDLGSWSKAGTHGVGMQGVDGAPDWHHQEIYAGEFCEQLKKLAKTPFRKNDGFLKAIGRVIRMPEIGKGRQAFILLSIDVGGAEVASAMADYLHDEELSAAVLDGLAKHRIRGFEHPARTMAGRGTLVAFSELPGSILRPSPEMHSDHPAAPELVVNTPFRRGLCGWIRSSEGASVPLRGRTHLQHEHRAGAA